MWSGRSDLDQADELAHRLELRPGVRLLERGGGWPRPSDAAG
jgi:cyclopropane fatty-acyl-phospholipid synthase-like methyltransferase